MDRRYEMLRHYSTLLARWEGGNARIYELTVSHTTLRLRVAKENPPGYLLVACLGPVTIKGPVEWSHANLKIDLHDPEGFVVTDNSCGLEVKAEGVEVVEFSEAE